MDAYNNAGSMRSSLFSYLVAVSLLPGSLLLLAFYVLHVALKNLASTIASTFGIRRRPAAKLRKVLITGASTPTGLTTARLLHSTGYTIVAADYEPVAYTSCPRVSAATDRFYVLSPIGSLFKAGMNASETDYFSTNVLRIAQHESPDLWIHCGAEGQYPDAEVIAQAKELIEADGQCRVLHPDADTLKMLTDEIQFSRLVTSMDSGLQAPEARNIFSRGEIHHILGSWPMKRRFMLEKLDPQAAQEARDLAPNYPSLSRRTSQRPSRPASLYSSTSTLTSSSWPLDGHSGTVVAEYAKLDALILPSSSMHDTYDRIASIKVSSIEPWSLQEIVRGDQYTARCLVIQGQLCAFILTADGRRGSSVVNSGAMYDRILDFMNTLVQKLDGEISTHLNVRFVLNESSATQGIQQSLHPVSADVEANATIFLHGGNALQRSHTAWRLSRLYYAAMPDSHPSALVEGKMGNGIESDYRQHRVLSSASSGQDSDLTRRFGQYSLPLSVVHLFLLPVLELLTFRTTFSEVLRCVTELFNRLVYEKEEYFEWNDPWPWLWFWIVTFPLQTLRRPGGYVI